jgi:hypothetical protein
MLLEASMRLSDQPGKAGFDPGKSVGGGSVGGLAGAGPARGGDGPSSIE